MVDQIIRPADLPNRADPVASEKIPVDNGVTVGGATIQSIVESGRPAASQSEAEAGINAEKAMTPLTSRQGLLSQIGVTIASKAQGDKADSAIQEIIEGTNTTVDNTDPQRPIISSSGNPSAGFKTDIVVVDGQTDWRVARNYKTVSDLLADDGSGDMGMGYAGSGANVIVSPGDIVVAQGFRYEVAASGATDAHVETAGGVKLYVLRVTNRLYADAFGLVANDEASAATNKSIWATVRAATLTSRGSKVVELGSATYWFPPETFIGETGVTLQGNATIIKQIAHTQNTNWLLFTQCNGFRMSGIEFDGNRPNTPNMNTDRSLVLIYDVDDVRVYSCKVHASQGKGMGCTSAPWGNGTRNIHFIDCEGWDCEEQVFICDRSNNGIGFSIPCDDILFERCVVGDTDHAGIAVNDGSRRVKVIDCTVDNNNTVWAGIAVRGSVDVLIQGCTGRRGAFGCQILVLNAAEIAAGAEPRNIKLVGNNWEFNHGGGLQIVGGHDVTVVGDTARNNGQTVAGSFGVTVISRILPNGEGTVRSSNVSLANVHSYDDQDTPTQHTAIAVIGSDNIRVSNPIMHGNTTRNRVYFNDVTAFEVTGDGPDGATKKRVSVSTGSIPASGAVTVTAPFVTAFDAAPNHVLASVLVGTSSPALVVEHIVGESTGAVSVRVRNTTAGALTGTLHVTAEYLS